MLSILLTLLAILFTVQDKPVKLAAVSLIHAASYSIFFMVWIGPALWLLQRRDRRAAVAAFSGAVGIGLGLLVNPYFPENVRFDLVQASVMRIAGPAHVKIAPELGPAGRWNIACCLPAALPWLVAHFVRLSKRKELVATPATNLFLLLSTGSFLGLLRVQRTADFFIPFCVLYAAAVLSPYLGALRADLATIGFLLAVPCAVNVYLTHEFVAGTPELGRFKGAAEYLRVNAPDALVLNTEWAPDYFFLFFLNSRSRYVIGIDPTFLYVTDSRKYWFWRHIWADEASTCDHENCADAERTDIVSASWKELGAQYVVADHNNSPRVESILRKNPAVTEVFRDAGVSVYKIDSCGYGAANCSPATSKAY